MNIRALGFVVLGLVSSSLVLASRSNDFVLGYPLILEQAKPLQQLTLPDDIYRQLVNDDLRSLQVFNAEGVAVPQALCDKPVADPVVSVTRHPLKVFPLLAAAEAAKKVGETDLEIKVNEKGEVHIWNRRVGGNIASEQTAEKEVFVLPKPLNGYVMDRGTIKGQAKSVALRWASLDGASEVSVSVQGSHDLAMWNTLVKRATLLRVENDQEKLERVEIPIPSSTYRYLRLERSDPGPPPEILEATLELENVEAARPISPVTFEPVFVGRDEGDRWAYLFDAQRIAPVEWLWVGLPSQNMRLGLVLDSRPSMKAEWVKRWQGNVDSVDSLRTDPDDTGNRIFENRDRYWRLRVISGQATLGQGKPVLRFGYSPEVLRFLAQGNVSDETGFLLALRSARINPEWQACDGLFQPTDEKQKKRMLGNARLDLGSPRKLGGEEVMEPPPPPETPVPYARYILWAVLVLGAGLLILMSLSLMRRVQRKG